MEAKWTYCAVYSIIQIHFVRGMWGEMVNAEDNIYALSGSDVNLICQTRKEAFLVQMQWSKVTSKVELIALYHPQHGFFCASKTPCDLLVAFTETPDNVLKWTLRLRNVSSSHSGNYECSFTLYPEGTWTKIYNLLIQTNVAHDEWRSNHTVEIETNQTLEIPCFQNISSQISSAFTFAWLVEGNGTQEILFTQDHTISTSTVFKDRIKLGADYGLYLSSVQIQDDDHTFSCHATLRPGKTLTSTTTVKVFAKPERPVIVQNNSTDGLGESTFTCSLRNVFPTANLTWFLDGEILQGEKEGMHITNEERKMKDRYLEVKSVLRRVHINDLAQSDNLTIWCMALFPVPGKKLLNISSEKISFSLGSLDPQTDPPPNITESSLTIQSSTVNSITSTRSQTTSSITPVDVNTSIPNSTPQTSDSSLTTQGFNYSWTLKEKDTEESISWTPSEIDQISPSGADSTLHIFLTIPGTEINRPKDGASWPVIIAALLLLCMVPFGLALRKWCQYQKEILQRPPPFKPPPPPIKYTCIQEPIGSDLPCHEMDTLYSVETLQDS
ncbi:PREDICTED: T-cell surface protein tactile [Elephantulus edwardii]|uniref:T-cell surface protein tactile n=1 Tax=Elephantulus edwardii TaxID=28737 RepID=UPI0003F0D2D7|nr:PREDICTED: T-cell surface protein tactile [Elephantulus edwardii]